MLNRSTIKGQLDSFRKALRAAHDPERARNEKRYLKSPYKFFGVAMPFIRALARDFKKANTDIDKAFVFELAGRLWESAYHQEKTLAIKLLERYGEMLDYESMPMIERMLSESSGWDHVDGIANCLVDAVLRKDRRAYAYLRKWSKSENFWLRRAALISQIPLFREGKGDKRLFFRLAKGMIGEREFFIRKAIGFTLREMSKADAEAVFDFLMDVKGKASSLTLREGARRLPQNDKKLILNEARNGKGYNS